MVDPGESSRSGAKRELWEESGHRAGSPLKRVQEAFVSDRNDNAIVASTVAPTNTRPPIMASSTCAAPDVRTW